MRTNLEPPTALFLFAHQDDEFGVFHQIEHERRAGRRVHCIYATDGSATALPDRRNAESTDVLKKLGVAVENIYFAGQELGIKDGFLHADIELLDKWLDSFLDHHSSIDRCFIPAWEGGHPDHDLLHAITVNNLNSRNRLEIAQQYPLYNGKGCRGPFFKALSPISENGPIDKKKFGWNDRLRYISLCLAYPSQWKSWIGLFPFVSFRILFGGTQMLQRVSTDRLAKPPHSGLLYYERRAFLDWTALRSALDRLEIIYQKKTS